MFVIKKEKDTLKLGRLVVLTISLFVLAVSLAHAGCINTAFTTQDTTFSIASAWSVYGFDVLSSGNYVAFIDKDIVEITPSGTVSNPLYSFNSSVYGSFVKVHDNSIYFGESSNGTIWKMGLDGTNLTQLGTVPYVYDMAFNSAGQAFVSAYPDSDGQKIISFNGSSDDVVTGLDGFSGPLAFDSEDNLLYGTVFAADGDSILRFGSTDVAGAIGNSSLTQGDGYPVASVPFASDMEVGNDGNIFYTHGKKIYTAGSTSFATSQYSLTSLAYNKQANTLYVLANGVTVEGKQVGVITAIQAVPEPGSLVGLAGMLSLSGLTMLRRRKLVSC